MQANLESIRAKQGWKVLIVDNEPEVCDVVKMMLEYEGHSAHTAGNGREALALFEQQSFDLVITDYFMSEMKGDKLAVAIKQLQPHLPVLMLTSHVDLLRTTRNPLEGVDYLISKPLLLEELRSAIAKVLPLTPSLTVPVPEVRAGLRTSL